MDQELNNEITQEEYDEIVTEKKELDLTILDNDEMVCKYINSLLSNSEQFYLAIAAKTYDKVLILNTEKVYQLNSLDDGFETCELLINSEEDYVILELINIVNDNVPVFKISTTMAELNMFSYLFTAYIKHPYYSWKFKRENKSA